MTKDYPSVAVPSKAGESPHSSPHNGAFTNAGKYFCEKICREWMEFLMLQAPIELFKRTMTEWLIRNVSVIFILQKKRFKSSIFSWVVRKK